MGVSGKFADMAGPVIGQAGAAKVVDAVRSLEDCADIGEIARLCGTPSHDA